MVPLASKNERIIIYVLKLLIALLNNSSAQRPKIQAGTPAENNLKTGIDYKSTTPTIARLPPSATVGTVRLGRLFSLEASGV